VIKSKRVGWVGLLTQSVLLETLMDRDQWQNLDIDGKLKLKPTLKQDRGVELVPFAHIKNILANSCVQDCETSGSIKWKKRDLLTN